MPPATGDCGEVGDSPLRGTRRSAKTPHWPSRPGLPGILKKGRGAGKRVSPVCGTRSRSELQRNYLFLPHPISYPHCSALPGLLKLLKAEVGAGLTQDKGHAQFIQLRERPSLQGGGRQGVGPAARLEADLAPSKRRFTATTTPGTRVPLWKGPQEWRVGGRTRPGTCVCLCVPVQPGRGWRCRGRSCVTPLAEGLERGRGGPRGELLPPPVRSAYAGLWLDERDRLRI